MSPRDIRSPKLVPDEHEKSGLCTRRVPLSITESHTTCETKQIVASVLPMPLDEVDRPAANRIP